MPFVNAKCTNCGAPLEVDNTKKAAICPYCGDAYIVEDAINNFTTNNYTTVEHLHANVVNLNSNPDFQIHAGEVVAYQGDLVDVIVPTGIKRIGGKVTDENSWINPEYDSNYHRYKGAFDGMQFLNSVRIPEGIEEIGPAAFRNCARLKSIKLPNSLVSIGDYAFYNCSSLSKVIFDDLSRLTYIGRYSFSECKNLTQFTIPELVASVGQYAFANSGIKKLTVNGTPLLVSPGADRPFLGTPVETLIASEEWGKQYYENFPIALKPYYVSQKRLEKEEKIYSKQKELRELEKRLHKSSIFDKQKKEFLKREIEEVKNVINVYKRELDELLKQ